MAAERTADQIRADLAAARQNFAVGVQGLVCEVHPKTLKDQAVSDVKERVQDVKANVTSTVSEKVEQVKAQFVTDEGVRWNRVGTVVLVGVAVVAVLGTAAILGGLATRVVAKSEPVTHE